MFFKDHFLSIADIIDSKLKAYEKIAVNAADKGELCEIFMKEFLIDSLSDSFKIFRGGRIVDSYGNPSKQIDIILTGKRSIKIFGDKGIYPTETVFGCFSITATLSEKKLIECFEEFQSIPKENYSFFCDPLIPEEYFNRSKELWRTLIPYKCIFAYKGTIKEEWIKILVDKAKDHKIPYNIIPDLIVVNKVGMIEKYPFNKADREPKLNYVPFNEYSNYGIPFARMLYGMNNRNWEEFSLRPKLEEYLNKDL